MRPLAALLVLCVLAPATFAVESVSAKNNKAKALRNSAEIAWPSGTEVLPFENLDGLVLVRSALRGVGGRDTVGLMVLDTGAGHVAIDRALAEVLDLADSSSAPGEIGLATRPLPRFRLGQWAMDQVEPILTVDASVVQRVSDRPVLGLIGQGPLRSRAVWIDYREQVVAFIPLDVPMDDDPAPSNTAGASGDAALIRSRGQLAGVLSPRAVAVRFAIHGDGKIFVRAVVSDPRPPRYSAPLDLLVDTGATKNVFFAGPLHDAAPHADRWPSLRGFTAPTLIGTAEASIVRVPVTEIETASGRLQVENVDAGVVDGDLGSALSRATGRTVHGLIGYSLLKRFRVVIDYPNRVLWLDPIPDYKNDRPLEYCQVGIQLERRDGAVLVAGVVAGSPAARAGIERGDELTAIDGIPARPLDLAALTRRLEGRPGTRVTLELSRDARGRIHPLVRRRLL